jgi:hypothetical protein
MVINTVFMYPLLPMGPRGCCDIVFRRTVEPSCNPEEEVEEEEEEEEEAVEEEET